MEELKPAHETMLESIQRHCRNIEGVDAAIAEGVTTTRTGAQIPPGAFQEGRLQEIGGLCSLLRTLEKTFVPKDKIDEMVAGLREITYRHAQIASLIENLRSRQA